MIFYRYSLLGMYYDQLNVKHIDKLINKIVKSNARTYTRNPVGILTGSEPGLPLLALQRLRVAFQTGAPGPPMPLLRYRHPSLRQRQLPAQSHHLQPFLVLVMQKTRELQEIES